MILKWIRALASSGPIYVKIKKNWMSVRDTATGEEFQDCTEFAVRKEGKITVVAAIGSNAKLEAAKPDVELKNGFNHPRIIVGDFVLAEKTLQYFLGKITKNYIVRPNPVLVIHVIEELDGGMSEIENRAFKELGAGAGGREVYIWNGRELSDEEIKKKTYEQGGEVN